MDSMELRFLTKNKNKAEEFQELFSHTSFSIVPASVPINEIQTEDMEELVKDKALKGFAELRRPVFVDHTGLYFDLLNGFPGGLTEIFWNRLENKGICDLIGKSGNPRVRAATLIGYCDGRTLEIFKGEISGTVASEPRGPEGFQWDPIFVPDGSLFTFAEMGPEAKNRISMRRVAINEFINHLNSHDPAY